MNNSYDRLKTPNNVNSSWEHIGDDIPFNEDLARARAKADYREEDPETQTIFVPTPEVAPDQTMQAQVEKEQRIAKHSTKIVESFATGKHVAEIERPSATDQEYRIFYERINSGDLTPASESYFLQTISTPMHAKNGFVKTYGALSSDHDFKILAFASGHGFGNNIPTTIEDLRIILEKYPTPVEFQAIEDTLIGAIRRNPKNPPDKAAEYERDFNSFKHKIYGKRQEYHEAWQNLEQQAKSYQILHTPYQETPKEYARKVKEGVYAQYLDPSMARISVPEQNSASANNYPADRRVIIKPRNPDTAKPEPKKGVFGKLFGRKK